MAELLLDSGADWRTPHGFGDTVLGTLSWASPADGIDNAAPRDYVGCARVIVAHGVPLADMERYTFSNEVMEYIGGFRSPVTTRRASAVINTRHARAKRIVRNVNRHAP